MLPESAGIEDYKEPTLGDEPDDLVLAATSEWREGIVDTALHGQRLDKVVVSIAPEFSRSHLQHLIETGHVEVDGVLADISSRKLRFGQRLRLELVPTQESRAFRPESMALVVLFEDEHLLVLDKPAGCVVHPAPGNWTGTLLNGLLAHHKAAAGLPRAGIVHRLDKDTSGVMMVGKTLPAVTALVRDMAARTVYRRYLALAHGTPDTAEFSIDAPIGRDPHVRVRMAVVAGGRASRTDVCCIASSAEFSALSCTLHSGRTHQIRVHLSARGLPLVADAVYGGRPALGLHRQALHATELSLAHPISRVPLSFVCEPPADFASGWAQIAPT